MGEQTKHTPGPWRVSQSKSGRLYIYADDSEQPLRPEVRVIKSNLGNGTQIANINLMAAAPDLLAACKAFVSAYEKSLQLEKTDTALRLAKEAIEKAEAH